jgi:hypothetical protein
VRSARRRGILNSFDVGGVFAMELVTPSSIAFSGTSASIVGSGSVDFSAVSSLSLNGVFSADYDNYMVAIRYVGSSSNVEFFGRLRASSTDNSTTNSYVYQTLTAVSTSVSGSRTTSNQARFGNSHTAQRSGMAIQIYGPHLAQPTAYRTVTAYAFDNATIVDFAGTHNQSVSYDGLTLYQSSGNMTGSVAVYGLRG